MKKRIKDYSWVMLPFLILIVGYAVPLSFFDILEQIRDFISQFGVLAPVVFILLQVVQVLVPPISHQTISLLGGVLFGFEIGFFYNWLGRILGSTIAFILAKKFGLPLVKKIITPKNFEKFEQLVKKGRFLILLMYLLPLFPDDEISYLLGLSGMPLVQFLPLVLVGHVTGSAFSAGVGSGILQKDARTFILVFIPSILVFILVSWFVKIIFSEQEEASDLKSD